MEMPSSPHIAVVLVAMVTMSLWPGVSATIGGGSCPVPGSLPLTLVPDQPYSVVWNQPAQHCYRQRGPHNFTDYGILENSNHQFIGDRVALFYNLGEWPQLRDSRLDWINGGLPQLANVTRHLEVARRHIEQLIPDPNFEGLGVIDMELWRPLFSLNSLGLLKYQTESIARVRLQYPDWPTARVEEEAACQYDTAARELMELTLLLARAMRPRGRWGYYQLPICFGNIRGQCVSSRSNDRLQWLFSISTALYPSIYLYGRQGEQARDHVTSKVWETFRVLDASRDPMVLAYVRIDLDPLDPVEVELSIRMPAELGMAGAVVWGSSAFYRHPQACDQLQTLLTQHLGPRTKQLLQRTRTCSRQLCSGHGRCTLKCSLESPVGQNCSDFDLSHPAFAEPFSDNYGCRCYSGWTGQSCSLTA